MVALLRNDYSWADLALSFGATFLLSVLAVASLVLRYVTNPISCWMPPEFTGAIAMYVQEVCYRRQSITSPVPGFIPESEEQEAEVEQPTYHLWVPFALGIGALICLVPDVIWRMVNGPLLLDTHSLLSSVAENQRQPPESRHALNRDTAILVQSTLRRAPCLMTVAALCRKLLSCVVCLVQIVLIVVLFRPQLKAGVTDENDEEDMVGAPEDEVDRNGSLPLPYGPFICRVKIKQVQNIQRWAVQCVLPINQVYSKGFTFLFYVFLLLAVLCTLDLLLWSLRLLVPGLRDVAVKRQLGAVTGGESEGSVSQLYPRFSQWLAWDGRLLLALTADHCGPLAAADLTGHLWALFKGVPRLGPAASLNTSPATVGATPMRFYGDSDPASTPLTTVSNVEAANGGGKTHL